jgi:hypothetical protein
MGSPDAVTWCTQRKWERCRWRCSRLRYRLGEAQRQDCQPTEIENLYHDGGRSAYFAVSKDSMRGRGRLPTLRNQKRVGAR